MQMRSKVMARAAGPRWATPRWPSPRLGALVLCLSAPLDCGRFDARTNAGDDAVVTSVSVTPAAGAITIGETLQLTAQGRNAAGEVVEGAPITWSSRHPTVTSVTQRGLVTALTAGTDTVVATSGGRTATAAIVVGSAPVSSDATFLVNTGVTHPISRFVYGMNYIGDGWGDASPPRGVTLDRMGGNRMSAYNWENNFSNAGNDYRFQNDNFMSPSTTPGEAVRSRTKFARERGAGIILTVPMIGYVAANANGEPLDTANATRAARLAAHFRVSKAAKGASYTLTPNAGDPFVYQDEFVNWVDKTFPGAIGDATTPIFFSLDNEPDLWHGTHGEITGSLLTYDGFIDTTIAYGRAVRQAAPNALIFGPAVATYAGVLTLGRYPSPDPKYPVWQTHPFFDVYLGRMRQAEQTYGKRLLDVLDLHWYPQIDGVTNDYVAQDAKVINARLQAPRSLWDPTYDEKSWVSGNTSGPIRLIPRLREQIAAHYPGTKIAITEYYYGRGGDISGGVAQADALGIFGREGVFAATLWPLGSADAYGGSSAKAYAYAFGAFRMYVDYDGAGGRFGDTGVSANSSDPVNYSVYGSLDAQGRVVVVAINKKSVAQRARLVVTHRVPLTSAAAYAMVEGSPVPARQAAPVISDGNSVAYTMPPMSVTTLVLSP